VSIRAIRGQPKSKDYLNATGFRLGLLVNFGHHGKLEWERIVK
jgi:PD-(D/E)XK nuclease superfamily